MPSQEPKAAPLPENASPEGVMVVDAAGCVLSWSEGAARLLGWSADELIGFPLAQVFPAESVAHVLAAMRDSPTAPGFGLATSFEAAARHRDGRLLELSAAVTPFRLRDEAYLTVILRSSGVVSRPGAGRAHSRDLVQSALDALSAHICVMDDAGIIRTVNESWRRFAAENGLGFPADGEGANYLAICERAGDPEAVAVAAGIRSVIRGERESYFQEYACPGPEGMRWFSVRVTAFAGPSPRWVVVAHLEITERRMAEDALRNVAEGVAGATGETFFRRLVQYLAETLDADVVLLAEVVHAEPHQARTRAVWEDGALAENFQFSPADGPCEQVGVGDAVVYPSGVRTLFPRAALLRELEAEGYLGTPLVDGGGTVVGILAALYRRPLARAELRAATLRAFAVRAAAELERERSERALRRSEARFQGVLAGSVFGVFFWNIQGDVTEANDVFLQLVGYTRADVRAGRVRWTAMTPSDWEPADDRALGELARYGHCTAYEKEFIRSDGKRVAVLLSAVLLEDSRTEGVAFALDITQQKLLEEQFRQSQKMEALGLLAGGVAHDFNNMLAVIGGYAEMLLGRPDLDEPLRTSLEQMHLASERAGTLTRQLLAFSRKHEVYLRPLDLNGVLRDVEKMLRRLIPERIHWSTELQPALGAVMADPGQIEQIIMNLAVNARDAMPAGGRLSVRTRDIPSAECGRWLPPGTPPQPFVLLEVSDTGCGMDRELLSRIWEPFFTTKEPGRGTGLGLPMVFGLVQQSGGVITVESEPGEGTTFRLFFPRTTAAGPGGAEASPALAAEPSAGTTILLVEDEPMVRGVARRVLEMKGFRVLEAESGEVALDVAAHADGPIHLVLTDVVMPGMSGYRLWERLRERGDGRVLFMSGYADDGTLPDSSLVSDLPLLEKPFGPKELLVAVRQALGEE